jgi:hypothetical protein
VLVELVFALLAGHDSGPGTPERDDFSSNHHPALFFCLSVISAQTFRVCPKIMLQEIEDAAKA